MERVRATTHRQVLTRLLKNGRLRRGYQEELAKLRIVGALIHLRERRGFTQQQLAKRLGVSQPLIAKIERAETHNFTLETLLKFVHVLNGKLTVQIKPKMV